MISDRRVTSGLERVREVRLRWFGFAEDLLDGGC